MKQASKAKQSRFQIKTKSECSAARSSLGDKESVFM